jgi:NAD(P)-dependent dehydrogenase (short-subunit alcohol dehydrogenase family)
MPTTLITGANRGIGLELARQYAGDGWRVVATCRDPDRAEALGELAGETDGRVEIHRLDVTDERRLRELARELGEIAIDVLIANAGRHGERDRGPGEVDPEVWSEVFRVNAIAPLATAGAFLEHVARSDAGRIVVVSSVMGSIGSNVDGGNYVYRSSKAAANAVARSLAIDLEPRGILVVALHPGWVRTDMGGAEAPLPPAESAAGCRKVIASLTAARSGTFLDYSGSPLPW